MNPMSRNRSLKGILLWTLGLVYLASFVIIATALAGVIYHDQVTVWRERHAEAAAVSARTLTMFLDRARQTLITMGELDYGEDKDTVKEAERVLLSDTSRTVLEVVQVDGQGRVVSSVFRSIGAHGCIRRPAIQLVSRRPQRGNIPGPHPDLSQRSPLYSDGHPVP